MPTVRNVGQNKRGGGGGALFLKDFRKYWIRMKVNAKLPIMQSDQPRNIMYLN